MQEQDLPRVDSQLGYRETVFDLGGGRRGKDGDGKQAVGTFSSGLTEREMAEAGILENDAVSGCGKAATLKREREREEKRKKEFMMTRMTRMTVTFELWSLVCDYPWLLRGNDSVLNA